MSEPHGLYVHVPFCVKKCAYCDFYSTSDLTLTNSFVAALLKEMKLRSFKDRCIDTIYFGGGTPSVLTARQMERILSGIHDFAPVSPLLEVTMEVNPGTVGGTYLADVYSLGVNRLNIGVQSFGDEKLKFLGRIHNSEDAVKALEDARRAGFENIGLDLMFGVPHEMPEQWRKDMDTAFSFLPEHLSCYMLTYEPDTPLDNTRRAGGVIPLEDEKVADLFTFTSRYAGQLGYDHYEVSNFAKKKSCQSRHNKKYWSGVPYTGFGPAAHSFDGTTRFWNHRDVIKYIHHLEKAELPVLEQEFLTREQVLMERVMLGLRTFEGLDISAFEQIAGQPFEQQFQAVPGRVEELGWGGISQGRFSLNLGGMVYLDTVVEWFVEKIV
ncbi:oxygen-independent coproporphyrinogen-3 oxidase [Desulfocicer vacuolatum DSM 3385]|uniref:Heme chaperone HemW n=1 Tax=Desulfocicer vacuolatum DSM 3385 TaxID=1121400 RepID=A0A1W2BN91_9BACT|nr:radical SAM family heme chaperone HemW [Desulfocicer vacuolatum]SMC74415.1 oxygen-independent coproporphyrinogen-3 oxidase [Desulfocicer vacuolatum DSM 3385]